MTVHQILQFALQSLLLHLLLFHCSYLDQFDEFLNMFFFNILLRLSTSNHFPQLFALFSQCEIRLLLRCQFPVRRNDIEWIWKVSTYLRNFFLSFLSIVNSCSLTLLVTWILVFFFNTGLTSSSSSPSDSFSCYQQHKTRINKLNLSLVHWQYNNHRNPETSIIKNI